MTDKITKKIKELGLNIDSANPPAANYIPYKMAGNLLYISGQTAKFDGKLKYTGKAVDSNSTQRAYDAAKLCGVNILSQLNKALDGNLEKISSCVRLNIYVNSTSSFNEYAQVANGVSDLMVEVLGKIGKHTRVVVGSNNLPSDSLVEVDAIFEVSNA